MVAFLLSLCFVFQSTLSTRVPKSAEEAAPLWYQTWPLWEKTWQKQDFNVLKRDALLAGYPDGLDYRGDGFSDRFVWAVAVHATGKHIDQILDELYAHASGPAIKTPEFLRKVQETSEWHTDVNLWADLARDYTPELKQYDAVLPIRKMCAHMHERLNELALAIPQFSDVPKAHWAAKDVLDLRRWGILDGYPDKKPGSPNAQNTFE